MNKILNKLLSDLSNCTGCGACAQACKIGCIKIIEDENLALKPTILSEKCIECGMCIKSCPIKNKSMLNHPSSYAYCYIPNVSNSVSSSGGVFYEIAKSIISNKGYVCASVYSEKLQVINFVSNKETDILRMCGSKYVYSNTGNAFIEISRLLNSGQEVLYCSTPCQVAGLKQYLNAHQINQDRLYLIDLFCAGCPSQGLFDLYIEWLQIKKHKQIVKYVFRDKELGWDRLVARIDYLDSSREYIEHLNDDPYYSSFISRKTLKDSCYSCYYTSLYRCGDLSIGDLWGANKMINVDEISKKLGISAVLINTQKGEELFGLLKTTGRVCKVDVTDVCKYNFSIVRPATKHKNNNYIFESLRTKGFQKTASRYMYETYGLKRLLMPYIPQWLKITLHGIKKHFSFANKQ